MINYKDCKTVSLGFSDIASLILRSPMKLEELKFGGDHNYKAYLAKDDVVIPEHYKLVFEDEGWLKIYDDRTLSLQVVAEKIRIYRAGEYGCIIQMENARKVIKYYGDTENNVELE